MLTREQILEANDLPSDEVYVPEWGDTVMVGALTGTERDDFEQQCMDARQGGRMTLAGLKARLCVLSLRDPVLGLEDAEALNAKSGAAVDRIFQVAQRLSGLRDEDVTELVGNSESDRNANSGSS